MALTRRAVRASGAVHHPSVPDVASQCVAEGVEEHAGVVTALVQSALSSEVVRRAAVREHWREMHVSTVQADGTGLEGYVDLVYREDDGSLVVVDYKTDAIPAGAVPARRSTTPHGSAPTGRSSRRPPRQR